MTQIDPFQALYCIDGSAARNRKGERKRPIYRVVGFADGNLAIERPLLDGKSAFQFLCDETEQLIRQKKRLLIAADVPIGLPEEYPEVYAGYKDFLAWLLAQHARLCQQSGDWTDLVAGSVAQQSAHRPFVYVQKGEKRPNGNFPHRRCDKLTRGESVYWCVGSKQVGLAALQFWFEVLLPLRAKFGGIVGIWPFEEVAEKPVVIAECYPASLQQRAWGEKIVKTDPLAVVEAVFGLTDSHSPIADARVRLHGASSQDEFDMLTAALALSRQIAGGVDVLNSPQAARPYEGWMLSLPEGEEPSLAG